MHPKVSLTTQLQPVSKENLTLFNEFIEQAKLLLEKERETKGAMRSRTELNHTMNSFDHLISVARPIVIREIRNALKVNRAKITKVSRWLIPLSCDILSASGVSRIEDCYIQLIGWLFWPQGYPPIALRLQKAWLSALGRPDIAAKLKNPAKPKTQIVTEDGRADLLLHFKKPDFLLIVEAKTGSKEHRIPSRKWQTEGYPIAVRRKLGLPLSYPGMMVFLTPTGVAPESSEAKVTTYETIVSTIAQTLSPDDVTPELKAAFSTVITHLLSCSCSENSDIVDALHLLQRRFTNLSDEEIISNIRSIGALLRTFAITQRK
ncbi:hypothetical protein L0152_21390 [bacterium]|nr:hypothetical protein [bacterium]